LSFGDDQRLFSFEAIRLRAADGGSYPVHLARDRGIADDKGGETVPQRIAADACLGERSTGTRTALRVASIGGNFGFGGHGPRHLPLTIRPQPEPPRRPRRR
jgi:hypothetical protein